VSNVVPLRPGEKEPISKSLVIAVAIAALEMVIEENVFEAHPFIDETIGRKLTREEWAEFVAFMWELKRDNP
jgi:hypothetical protein